jgi:hypothetical protein
MEILGFKIIAGDGAHQGFMGFHKMIGETDAG